MSMPPEKLSQSQVVENAPFSARPRGITKEPTRKRLRQSIRLDAVHPTDYLQYRLPYACEDCTHFDGSTESCTLGYNAALHRRAEHERTYLLNGKMALCRFLEID